MKKILTTIFLMVSPLISYGENINLLCKYDSDEKSERFNTSFPISLKENNDGKYSIYRNDKNVETLSSDVSSVKVSDTVVTKNDISFNVYKTIPKNTNTNSGYEDRNTRISRIDGRVIETFYWKGGLQELLFGVNSSNPVILTGTCIKRISNKF